MRNPGLTLLGTFGVEIVADSHIIAGSLITIGSLHFPLDRALWTSGSDTIMYMQYLD